MQNIDLICIGKLNMPFYAAGVAEYQKRLAAFCNFRIIELPEAAIDERHASAAQVEKALDKEAKAILGALRKGEYLAALCVEGQADLQRGAGRPDRRPRHERGRGTSPLSSVPPTAWPKASSARRKAASRWGASPCPISWPAWS